MTPELETLLVIRGAIAGMSPEVQSEVAAVIQAIAELKKQYSEEAVHLAIAYCGAELAAA